MAGEDFRINNTFQNFNDKFMQMVTESLTQQVTLPNTSYNQTRASFQDVETPKYGAAFKDKVDYPSYIAKKLDTTV